MIKNRAIDFSFVILIGSFVASLVFIYAQERIPDMVTAGGTFLGCSVIVLMLHYVKSHNMPKVFRWINILITLGYVSFGFIFALIMLYASPDNGVYYIESSMFLISTMTTSSVLFAYLKNESSKVENILLLLVFISISFLTISLSMIHTYASVDGVARPLPTTIGFLGVSILIFFSLNKIKEINFSVIKKIYIVVSILITLYFIFISISFFGLTLESNELAIKMPLVIMTFAIFLNIFSVREFISSKNTKLVDNESSIIEESTIDDNELQIKNSSENIIILFLKKIFFGIIWSVIIFILFSTILSFTYTSDKKTNEEKQTFKEAYDSGYDNAYPQGYEFGRKYGLLVFIVPLALGFGGSFMRVLPGTRRKNKFLEGNQ